MYFECNQGFVGENGLSFDHRFHSIHGHHLSYSLQSIHEPSPLEEWYQVLWTYGPRKLTKPSDKLPALSGLARIFSERLDDEYLAGLWKKDLLEGLLWQGLSCRRVKPYRAPSWSWASMDGIVGDSTSEKFEPVARVLDQHIELSGQNPFGEVKSGWLKIQAPLQRLYIDENFAPDGKGVPYENNPKVRTETGSPEGTHARFDFAFTHEDAPEVAMALVKSLREVEIFAMVLGKQQSGSEPEAGRYHYQCLIVGPAGDGSDAMRRLGFLFLDEAEMGECKYLDPDSPVEHPLVTLV